MSYVERGSIPTGMLTVMDSGILQHLGLETFICTWTKAEVDTEALQLRRLGSFS